MAGRRRRALAYALATSAGLVGCSILVPGDVPEYQCRGTAASSCPSGMVCDSASRLCVSPSALTDGGDEEPDEEEDASDADQDVSGPSPVGGACVVDGDCEEGLLCGTSTILTTAIVPANSKPICTKPCCTSQECADGFVCFPSGTGGNYCVAAERAKRSPPDEGGRRAGQTCAEDEDCRSGECTPAGRCADTCCGPSDCASGTTCRIDQLEAHSGWVCGPPNTASGDLGEACSTNPECKNDNCVQPFSAARRCTPTCCSASDCSKLGFPGNVCAYGQAGTDRPKWCFESNASGKSAGSACKADTDCASRYCDSELGRCANVCCTADDCDDDESCRPSPVGTPFLRCVKNR